MRIGRCTILMENVGIGIEIRMLEYGTGLFGLMIKIGKWTK